jgi:putative ABC transport system substrate-binding protein
MEIMKKKFLSVILSLGCAAMLLSGCGNSKSNETAADSESKIEASKDKDGESTEAKEAMKTDKVLKVGVIQFVQHDALDQTYEGFRDALEEAGYIDGENIEITLDNAQGDQSNCPLIMSKLVNNNSDLILAIATPAAQAASNATNDIPILVTAVTDPAESGLVASNEAPGGNITGTSDLTPIKEQMELLKELVPEAETVAVLYCSSESNSKIQADIAKEEAEKLGLTVKEATVSSSNEIQQVTQSLVGKVDAIYIPTDNIVAAGMQTVSQITTANKIPVICGEPGMVENGGLATKGINYYKLGRQTGEQAVRILSGEAEPATMPIEYLKEVEFKYNPEILEELGLELPADLK